MRRNQRSTSNLIGCTFPTAGDEPGKGSLQFRHEARDREFPHPVPVVNYPCEDVAPTRITGYTRLTAQKHLKTITYVYPAAKGAPYCPVPRPENAAPLRNYRALANATADFTFVGRLATSRYRNMDEVVAQALPTYARIDRTRGRALRTAGTAAGAAAHAAA